MGIPTYFSVIVRAYPAILSKNLPECTHYFMDYNGCIHQAVHALLKENPASDNIEAKIMTATWEYTLKCIELVNPSDTVSICMDSVDADILVCFRISWTMCK
jgi:5'-3' exonuclease